MRPTRRAGMGLVEFLGILVVLVAVAFAFYCYVDNRAAEGRRAQTIARMTAVQEALEKYLLDAGGALPTQKQGLVALVRKPEIEPIPRDWHGPYVKDEAELRDGWGRPLKYFRPGGALDPKEPGRLRPFDLASYGRDGQEGGRGLDRDLHSWERSTMVP